MSIGRKNVFLQLRVNPETPEAWDGGHQDSYATPYKKTVREHMGDLDQIGTTQRQINHPVDHKNLEVACPMTAFVTGWLPKRSCAGVYLQPIPHARLINEKDAKLPHGVTHCWSY